MRLYIRNKEKYDPSKAGKTLVFVEFPDPRVFSVGQVKEEFKRKARAAKIDSLYFRQEDGSYEVLADDRTIGFYNIQNDAILETTSNPLWAATIYYRLREVERDAATRADDPRAARGLEQSLIQKYMALGILFSGGNYRERQQPPYFEELDQLFDHLQTAGKKPVHMSQQTLDTLQRLKDEYEQNDVHEKDSIGHFVRRQAVKLGFTSTSNGCGDSQYNGRNNGGDGDINRPQGAGNRGGRGRGNNRGKRPAGVGRGGRRTPQKQRMCEDCEENAATQFCADCQPPLVLCDNCAVVLHRGATRRNHQLKDVSEAPAPAKGYTPKAYRAPFAMLVAFHRASNEVPSKMSLTTDELKSRAQPLTNTDLEIKQGRWFGGFDSLENALMKNELVQKEARTPKYSLLEKGQMLSARCSEFDYAVQNLTQAASVPTIPVMAARPVFRNRQVCLLVDSEEPLRERFVRVAQQRGLSAKTRKLPVGDFLWVLLPPGVNPDTVRDMPEQELVLSMVVERKTWDDLWSSLKTKRFINQVNRMKDCGLDNLFYLVEGSPKELKGNPGPEVESFLQDKIDNLLIEEQFLVNRTGSWLKTVEWLCHLTNMAIEYLQSEGYPSLMTYSEFTRGGKLKKSFAHIATVSAVPATSTVWSATEFTDIIRSHSNGGMEIRNLPVSFKEERSLVVIQGLTLYNKQCHKLLDKALADLLENTHQTAEACVEKHLQGVTDQLIHEDVPQWYILWLQVFKGMLVRRTDTEEESAEILGRFYQTSAGGLDALFPHFEDVDHINAQETERAPEDDLMFASDSQEEDAMIRQALRASQYENKMPEPSIVRPPTSTTTKPSSDQFIASNSEKRLPKFSLDSMNEKEQIELAMQLSKAEGDAVVLHNGQNGNPLAKPPTKSCTTDQPKGSMHTTVRPRTKQEVRKPTHTAVSVDRTNSESPNDELEEVLKQSLEEFGSVKQKQDDTINISDTDRDLEKVLELSRLEYDHTRNASVSHKVQKGGTGSTSPTDIDEELQRVLELSKLEAEAKEKESRTEEEELKNKEITCQEEGKKHTTIAQDDDLQKVLEQSRMEYEQHRSETLITLNDQDTEPETNRDQNSKEPSKSVTSQHEEGLAKALEISRTDYKFEKRDVGNKVLDKTEQSSSEKSKEHDLQEDGDLAKVLEMSKRECGKPEDRIGLKPLHEGEDKTIDSDLERALKLSKIEYMQSTSCSLDEKQEDTDVTILEDNDLTPERSVPALKLKSSSTPVKDFTDAAADDVVPSSVTSEWDPDSDNQDMFSALDPSTPVGSSKCSAILLLDSQEFDDESLDTPEVLVTEDVAKANRRQLFSLESKNSADDDFAYALKLQEELNNEVKNTDNDDNSSSKNRTRLELEDQLTCYRASQKEKYGAGSRKGDKSSSGLDFRRNVAAIATGRPVQIGNASPISRPGHSQKKQDSHRVLGDKASPANRIDRGKNGLHNSANKKQGLHKDDVFVIRDEDDIGCKVAGSLPGISMRSNDGRSLISSPGTTSSSRPVSSSSSSFERVHKRDPPTFPGSHLPSSSVYSPSRTTSTSTESSHFKSTSDRPMGPKCGACGEVGHAKTSKMCPQYFSAESVQRREEQSRKRKAKREEEERDLNDRLGAMAAQRLVVEERTRTITAELEELRRQSENMANTQKMVEDVIKRKRKR